MMQMKLRNYRMWQGPYHCVRKIIPNIIYAFAFEEITADDLRNLLNDLPSDNGCWTYIRLPYRGENSFPRGATSGFRETSLDRNQFTLYSWDFSVRSTQDNVSEWPQLIWRKRSTLSTEHHFEQARLLRYERHRPLRLRGWALESLKIRTHEWTTVGLISTETWIP